MIKIFFLLAFVLVLFQHVSAQDFVITITNKVAANSTFTFDVMLNTKMDSIAINDADFYFSYNNNYLSNPTIVAAGLGGKVSNFQVTKMAINIQGLGNHTNPQRIVTTTPRLVCSVQFKVSPSQTNGALDNFACAGDGGVFKLNNSDSSITATYVCNITPNVVLPLTLLDFKVMPLKTGINILWQTANEINFSRFGLQRSTNAQNFKTITEIKGKGSGDYNYFDTDIQPVIIYYYRLKLLDLDGSYSYSNIKSASIFGKNSAYIYPNPTSGFLNLNINSNTADNMSFDVINISGKVILNKNLRLVEGENSIEINISDFPVGVYSILFNSGIDLPTMRFVKN